MKTPYPLPETPGLDPFLRRVLEVAAGECGVVEDPAMGQNRGVEVDRYLLATHLNPENGPISGYPWCAAFVYWCFQQAASDLSMVNPCYRTAGVVRHWDKSVGRKILAADVVNFHAKVKPGMVFCRSHDTRSHTGFVVAVTDAGVVTIEGNTNVAGSREGNAVVGGKVRPWGYVELGYLDYSGTATPVDTIPKTS